MPNWAYSQYIATGDKEQLKKLYSIMSELEEMKALETYSRSHSDLCYTLEEFELLDD